MTKNNKFLNKIANSLVKSKYRTGNHIVNLSCGAAGWNMNSLPVTEAEKTALSAGSIDIVTAFKVSKNHHDIINSAHSLLKEGGYCIASLSKKDHASAAKISEFFLARGFNIELAFVVRLFTFFLVAQKKVIKSIPGYPYSDVTVILPTLNEEKNIGNVLFDIFTNCAGSNVIVADDGSRDRTKEIALNQKNGKVIFLDRSKESIHGLTISILDAIGCAKTKYVIVMDADGQHPASKISEMLNLMQLGGKFVVASRVGHDEDWPFERKVVSYVAAMIGKVSLLARGKKYITCDIMSGFFGGESEFLKKYIPGKNREKYFRLKGYKVLFDYLKIIPSALAVEEIYYKFESRKAGMSKINTKVMVEYLKACFS